MANKIIQMLCILIMALVELMALLMITNTALKKYEEIFFISFVCIIHNMMLVLLILFFKR